MEELNIDIASTFNATPLGQKFSLYIPNQDQGGSAINQDEWVQRALNLFSRLFGGATAFPNVKGAWLNNKTQQLIVEEPQIVYSYASAEAFQSGVVELRQFMIDLGKETNQGQIGFEFDGVFFLIDI